MNVRVRSECQSQKWMSSKSKNEKSNHRWRQIRNGSIRTAVLSKRDAIRFKAALIYFASCFFKFDMAGFISTSQSHSSYPDRPLRPNLESNASEGSRLTTEHGKSDRPRRKWLVTQDEEIQKRKLRSQNWAKRREWLNELFVLNPQLSKALDMKECMLKVQRMILGKLAAEENHLKGLAETSNRSIANFDDRVKEVEEVIRSMQYWDVDWASNLRMNGEKWGD